MNNDTKAMNKNLANPNLPQGVKNTARVRDYLKGQKDALKDRWDEVTQSVYVLDFPIREQPERVSQVPIRQVERAEELADFVRQRAVEEWQQNAAITNGYTADLKRRFARGEACYAAVCDGEIASIFFVSPCDYHIWEVRYTLHLPPKTVMLYDVYTLQRYRSLGLYKSVFQYGIQESLKAGYTTAWVCILPDNVRSLKVHQRLGINHIRAKVTMTQKWGIRRHTVEPLNQTVADLNLG